MLLLLVALTVDLRDERKVLLQARPFPVAARMQRLKDFGVTWYSPVYQEYDGEPNVVGTLGMPYVPDPQLTGDVLETENEATRSTEARYPYVKYYGQPTSFIHGTDLDPSFYNYMDGYETNEFDNTYEDYSTFLDV
uniref:Uncharacterized protein n=1 Tax=Hanusia phi TaxID=3032 RepID=A0A7S0NCU9_9CRYP